MHHIAFLDDVFLALETQAPCFFRTILTIAGNVVVVADGLGADKALFKIRVDLTGRLRCGCPDFGRPRPNFLGAGREKRL